SKKVKVTLSGLGGDELFAGYTNNDFLYPMTLLPKWMQSEKIRSLAFMNTGSLSTDLYQRAAELTLNVQNPLSFYGILRNSFDHNPTLLKALYANPPKHWHRYSFECLKPFFDSANPDVHNELLALEARTKLPNDFLLTEDRVSMAHSLEVRVPFLDKELVNLAFSLPSSHKYLLGCRKRILKRAVAPWLPKQILEKKKWGFSFNPYLLFQTGPLRTFATEILTEKKVKEMGLFSWQWISSVLEARPSPRLRWHYFNLWVMAGFVMWHDIFFGGQKVYSAQRDNTLNPNRRSAQGICR
ncbi:MAG: asparagine synthase, partial [Deltaproteobacteria bacterium]|nr:asparagine synthase [Deltaproteobacteria bacterium]